MLDLHAHVVPDHTPFLDRLARARVAVHVGDAARARVAALLASATTAVLTSLPSEMFATESRYTGVSVAHQGTRSSPDSPRWSRPACWRRPAGVRTSGSSWRSWCCCCSPDGRTDLADRLTDAFTVLVDGSRVGAGAARLLAQRIPAGVGAVVLLLYGDENELVKHDGPDIRVVLDVDGVYGPHFAATGAVVEVLRPDFHVYGTAADLDGGFDLVDSLRTTLHLRPDLPAFTLPSHQEQTS